MQCVSFVFMFCIVYFGWYTYILDCPNVMILKTFFCYILSRVVIFLALYFNSIFLFFFTVTLVFFLCVYRLWCRKQKECKYCVRNWWNSYFSRPCRWSRAYCSALFTRSSGEFLESASKESRSTSPIGLDQSIGSMLASRKTRDSSTCSVGNHLCIIR